MPTVPYRVRRPPRELRSDPVPLCSEPTHRCENGQVLSGGPRDPAPTLRVVLVGLISLIGVVLGIIRKLLRIRDRVRIGDHCGSVLREHNVAAGCDRAATSHAGMCGVVRRHGVGAERVSNHRLPRPRGLHHPSPTLQVRRLNHRLLRNVFFGIIEVMRLKVARLFALEVAAEPLKVLVREVQHRAPPPLQRRRRTLVIALGGACGHHQGCAIDFCTPG